jgi:hypothetical protein
MPTIYYYGDQRITGNYTNPQNFVLSGSPFQTNNLLTASTSSNVGNNLSTSWYNLYVTGANVTVLNVTSLASLNVVSLTNIFTSNSITTPNVFAASINTSVLSFTNLFGSFVTGNATVYDSLVSQNVYAQTINSSTVNSLTLGVSKPVGIGTSSPGTTNLYVQGNAYVSNALSTTNLFVSGTLNVASINALSVISGNNIVIGQLTSWQAPTTSLYSIDIDTNCLWTGVAWSPGLGLFVACGWGGDYNSAWSSDGKTWVAPTTSLKSIEPNCQWQGVAWSPVLGLFVACGNGGTYNSAWSSNGQTWQIPTTSLKTLDPNCLWTGVAWSPGLGLFVACGRAGAATYNSAWSSNGQTWQKLPTPTGSLKDIDPNCGWRGVAWSPEKGLFVACGSGGTYNSAWSSNGQTWQKLPTTTGSLKILDPTCIWLGVAWSPGLGLFVACGSGGSNYNSAWSSDGQTWQAPTTSLKSIDSACAWYGVAWSSEQNLFVACGSGGTYNSAFSSDGKTWQPPPMTSLKTIDPNCTWVGVAWSPGLGLFVACGYGGSYNSAYLIQIISTTSNLYVQGNAFIDTITVRNIFYTGTLSAPPVSNNYLYVGIGTDPGTTILYVQGNAFISTNTSVSNKLTYTVEDLSRRSPHLVPSATNAPSIQAWISATCNAASKSWWATSQRPNFSNVTVINNGYQGGVLIPDGRVLFVPGTSSTIGSYQQQTGIITTVSPPGLVPGNFSGGVLLPNGNVVFCPQTSNVGMYNPLSGKFSNSASLPGGAYSGVLTANNIIFAPQGVPSDIINYNFTTGLTTNFLSLTSSGNYGKNWSAGTTTAGANWNSVTWSPELRIFVAVASSGASSWSPDGKKWIQGNSTINGSYSIIWSPQLRIFVNVSFGGSSSSSTDGKTWDSTSNLPTNNWSSVIWSPQLRIFVAVAEGGSSSSSTDGKTWDSTSNLPTNYWDSVTWSPQLGLFVAIASVNYPTSASSPDGKTWTASSSLPASGTVWSSVTWSPQLKIFVAVGSNGSKSSGASSDGKNWNTATNLNLNGLWRTVTWSPELGIFVAYATLNSSYVNPAYSIDGYGWLSSNQLFGGRSVAWSPQLGIFSAVATDGSSTWSSGPALQQGTCLLPNGNVIAPSPSTANVIQFNPVSLASSNITVGTDGYTSLVLAPNGNVIGVPQNSNILVINPSAFTSSTVTVPVSNANCTAFFGGGCLLPSGNIIFTPSLTLTANVGSSNVGMFDPVSLNFSNSTPTGTSFSGATLIPSGQVVFSPSTYSNIGIYNTMIPVSREFCLSPYFNKL